MIVHVTHNSGSSLVPVRIKMAEQAVQGIHRTTRWQQFAATVSTPAVLVVAIIYGDPNSLLYSTPADGVNAENDKAPIVIITIKNKCNYTCASHMTATLAPAKTTKRESCDYTF